LQEVYWHLSPDNLTTFILTTTQPQPQPLVWNIDNRALQAQQLKAWIKTWDTQYADYRDKKSPKTQPRPNGEATDTKADLPWRTNLTAHLIQLKQILDIDNICQQLPANLTNLILIPHGDLHRFPLHILFLIAQKSQIRGCTYLPSIQIGLNLRDRSSQSYTPLLSVEDPKIEGEEPMKFAPIESAIVRHLLPSHNDNTYIDSVSADLKTIETALSKPHASFHFTGHAAYNSRSPEASALALTDEPLTAKQISQLDLSSYNLITLAACETAITGRANINTEYIGLTSAFLQAGAANILSTLWQVDEISNAWFTIYFHQQLLAGHSPAIALTRTQIWLKTVTWQNLADWLLELKQLPHLKIGIVDKLQSHITNTLLPFRHKTIGI
jgi:CHAT domain-containing protein